MFNQHLLVLHLLFFFSFFCTLTRIYSKADHAGLCPSFRKKDESTYQSYTGWKKWNGQHGERVFFVGENVCSALDADAAPPSLHSGALLNSGLPTSGLPRILTWHESRNWGARMSLICKLWSTQRSGNLLVREGLEVPIIDYKSCIYAFISRLKSAADAYENIRANIFTPSGLFCRVILLWFMYLSFENVHISLQLFAHINKRFN